MLYEDPAARYHRGGVFFCVQPRRERNQVRIIDTACHATPDWPSAMSARLLLWRPRAEEGQQQFNFFLGTDLDHSTHFKSPVRVRHEERSASSRNPASAVFQDCFVGDFANLCCNGHSIRRSHSFGARFTHLQSPSSSHRGDSQPRSYNEMTSAHLIQRL